jgi:hypothetical protein
MASSTAGIDKFSISAFGPNNSFTVEASILNETEFTIMEQSFGDYTISAGDAFGANNTGTLNSDGTVHIQFLINSTSEPQQACTVNFSPM